MEQIRDMAGRYYKILNETENAYLIDMVNGTGAWVQKSGVKKGIITEAGYRSVKFRVELKSRSDSAKPMSFTRLADLVILRESAKAYGLRGSIRCEATDRIDYQVLWIPKSSVKNGLVPNWILNKKFGDLKILTFTNSPVLDLSVDGYGSITKIA